MSDYKDMQQLRVPEHTPESIEHAFGHIKGAVVAYLRQVSGKHKLFDLDMWQDFDIPHEYARTQSVMFSHEGRISPAEAPAAPYIVTPSRVDGTYSGNTLPKRPALNPHTQVPLEYDLTAVFPHTMRLIRFNNGLPFNLNAAIAGGPGAKHETALRVARNEGRDYLTAAILKAGHTHDTQRLEDRGIFYRGSDYGTMNRKYLEAFGPIQEKHLSNGCIQLPPAVMERARLPFVHEPRFSEDGVQLDVKAWILVPWDHMIAWAISGESHSERMRKFGVYAIDPIRCRDKKTGEIRFLYWVIPDVHFNKLIQHTLTTMMHDVRPCPLSDCGIALYPSEAESINWSDVSINTHLELGKSTNEQIAAVMHRHYPISASFSVSYTVFPKAFRNLDTLGARCPPGWYKRDKFVDQHRGVSMGKISMDMAKKTKAV